VTLQFHQGPDGPYWVRPRYRREDYLVDPNSMRAIESDGKYWVRLRQSDADYCVDVAVTQSGQVSLN
jgi:hypothetical protein